MASTYVSDGVQLPRVAITYCTQCRWMLRAGYFGQELLSTFGTSIGEIALIPATGGKFTVHLTYKDLTTPEGSIEEVKNVLIWDRKAEGGFPETKILKQRVRNHIEPDKDLGHSDTPASNPTKSNERRRGEANSADSTDTAKAGKTSAAVRNVDVSGKVHDCEDCK